MRLMKNYGVWHFCLLINVLRILLVILGTSAIVISLSVFLAGPTPTASFFESTYNAFTGANAALTGPWPPTMDSELRFYAPFWGAYGVALLAIASDLSRYRRLLVLAISLFFIGGLGRFISWITIGAPHPFFTLLMAIELILPVLIIGIWLPARSQV